MYSPDSQEIKLWKETEMMSIGFSMKWKIRSSVTRGIIKRELQRGRKGGGNSHDSM